MTARKSHVTEYPAVLYALFDQQGELLQTFNSHEAALAAVRVKGNIIIHYYKEKQK